MTEHLDRYDCIDIGDWVRFFKCGLPTIGQVQYIVKKVGGFVDFYTDAGVTSADSILEIRRPTKEGGE